MWDNGKKIAEYEYNADGTKKHVKNGSLYTEYAYDADRNLTGLKTLLGAETIVDNRYIYDGNGDRLEKYQKHDTTRYGYDSMRRLAKVEYPDATEELFYDKAGNRTRRLYNGAEELYQYDKRNRLTAHTKGGVTSQYEYDNAGNLLKDDNARYEYDAFNRNTKVETFNGNIQINRYDAEGLRHEMEENGRLVSFIFRGDEVVAEESQEDRIRYIRTSVLLASDAESARTYYHYASDEMSSVTHVVDGENEEILNRYEYDAWGNLTTCEEKVHNRFKFNGQQYDPISQQYYLRARYYNPVIGRFTQEDSYNVDGLNLYAYCRNNPVYYVDPSGNICEIAADRIRKKIEKNTATFWEKMKLDAYDRNKKRLEIAEANYKLAREVYDHYETDYGKKTVASDGEHFTLSGWSKDLSDEAMIKFDRNRNLTREVVDTMHDMEKRTGGNYTPKESWKDNGVENKYFFYASHAEKQVSIYGGSEIGVTRNMCSDCVKYFTTKANGADQDIIIADRKYIHIFTTTGDHIRFAKSKKDII